MVKLCYFITIVFQLDLWKASSGVGDEAHVMVSPDKRLRFAELVVRKGLKLDVHKADVGE